MSNQYTDSQDYDGDEYDISQLRTDLDRSGPSIEGAYGVGYSITPKDASIVVRRIGNQIEYCELIPNPDKEGKWAEANPLVPDYPSRPIEWDRKKYGISKRDLKDEVQWYRYKWSKSDKKYKLKRRWSLEEINYPKDFMVERVDGRLQWYEFQVHEDTKSLTRTSSNHTVDSDMFQRGVGEAGHYEVWWENPTRFRLVTAWDYIRENCGLM